MVYQTLDSINTSEGLHTLYIYVNDLVPIFTPLVLFSFFIVMWLGSYFAMELRGVGNLAGSFVVAGLFVSVVATFMSFIPGMINLTTMVTCYGITMLGFLWLIVSSARN